MIELFNTGCGDMHSLVAYMSYPNVIPRDTDIKDIKKLYHKERQDAKAIEFAINYGGDAHTIATNKGIPIKQAENIYRNYMKGFPQVAAYQDFCRKEVHRKGYILMDTIFGHRAHIYDSKWQKRMAERENDAEFMRYYYQMKKESPDCDTVQEMKRYQVRKSTSEKQSINYRIQHRGAGCVKSALIMFFNWILRNNYQGIVKICAVVHDEVDVECPESMAEEVKSVLEQCMIDGGKAFCPGVFLGADAEVAKYWKH